MSENSEIASGIKRKAFDLGFSACGFAKAESIEELGPGFRDWLASGKAGEMNYLARNIKVRLNPDQLVEGAKTIISLAAGYFFPIPQHTPGNPRISRYAAGEDYHQVLKSRGKELLSWMQKEYGPMNGRVFTDSAPIFEREWARRAGIGWIGKNGCLIIPGAGSWFFLAEIIIDYEILPEAKPVAGQCGKCNRCIEACPTKALASDGSMDPRKCISYLTIELKSDIPDEFHGNWKDWIFGCDICQEVCPRNRNPVQTGIMEFQPGPGFMADRNIIRNLNSKSFRQLFDGTPVMRAGWSGILRNFEFLERNAIP